MSYYCLKKGGIDIPSLGAVTTSRTLLKYLCASIIALIPLKSYSEDESSHLISAFDDQRAYLEEHGYTVEAVVTNDLIANTSGGISRTAGVLGNVDLTLTVDTEKARLWEHGTFFLYVLGDYGKKPSQWVGDTQVTDNIEADSTVKIYEAWYEHSFADDSVSVLGGLYDYNSEFYALDLSANLLNSSFGVGPDLSQVGPSIFPTTSLALRVKYLPTESFYIQSAVFDGVPGDPNDPHGTHIRFESNDGFFTAGEFGWVAPENAQYWKFGVGGWFNTAKISDLNGDSADRNGGAYSIGEAMLLPEAEDIQQGLGAFYQIGTTRPEINQIQSYIGGGVVFTGLIPARDHDALSFGFAYARNSSDYMSVNEGSERAEKVYEINYRAEILPYLALSPDIQFVVDPGTDPALHTATVLGLRAEVAL